MTNSTGVVQPLHAVNNTATTLVSSSRSLFTTCNSRYSLAGPHSDLKPSGLLEPLEELLTTDFTWLETLTSDGVAVVDGAISASDAAVLRTELDTLALDGLLAPNQTHIVDPSTSQRVLLLPKPGVAEGEFGADTAGVLAAAAPRLAALHRDPTLLVLLGLAMPQERLARQALKVQHNDGSGGCFPLHVDSHPGVDERRFTALLYLSDDWQSEHGGELRVFPVPSTPFNIAPKSGRLVLFPATSLIHRVLPAHAKRHCLTLWLSGPGPRQRQQQQQQQLKKKESGEVGTSSATVVSSESNDSALSYSPAWSVLLQPRVRPHACRWLLAAEWQESLRESHGTGAATEAAVSQLQNEVAQIENVLVNLLQRRGLDAEAELARLRCEWASICAGDIPRPPTAAIGPVSWL